MIYFLLGLAALIIGLLLLRGFVRADTRRLARHVRAVGGVTALALAAVFVFQGFVSYALPLAMLGSWLLWGRGGAPWANLPGGGGPAPGRTSRVATDHLEMELDHDSGAMRGRVLQGAFAGRELEALSPAELAQLWRDCRFADPQSAQLIEAYLEREHPSWRDDLERASGGRGGTGQAGGPPGAEPGRMSRAEAYRILGLAPGAGEDDIRRAHRELLKKMHPDRGGSDWLAAKINEAKDVLLAG